MSINVTAAAPRSKTLRKGRVSIPGQVYLVTAVTHGRNPWFRDFDLGCLASRVLNAPRLWPDAHLLAWVLMPDHVHLLLELGQEETLALAIQRVKSLLSTGLRQVLGHRQVWQPGFHDHALRKTEDISAVARYIIANPLRAGLAERVGDYPFWGSVWLDPQAHPLDL